MKINLLVAALKWAYEKWAEREATYTYSQSALIGYCTEHRYLAEIVGRKGGDVKCIYYRHKKDLRWRKTTFAVKKFLPYNDYKVVINVLDGYCIIVTSLAASEGVTYD